ncbi:mutS protein homolog 5 [Clarias gariepinus]|uniref:mutS protein homolog 5 n=1 Tax=Clarias gariepinus TaxID=13013 RepID=UPI00234D186A|nr:mutS protein homolog 5 [Clarias gariepinus]
MAEASIDNVTQVGDFASRAAGLDGDENENEETSEVLLCVLVHHGQVGLSFYDSKDCSLNVMPDTVDNRDLSLLDRIVHELSPHVLITSAKQERSLSRFIRALASNPDCRPEIVVYPNANFGLEVSKQRLLAAHLPFLPQSITEKDRLTYLSSCIPFDSVLMMRTIGSLLKCLDRRRVGVELEERSVPVPILQFLTYSLSDVVYMDKDAYSVLQIFKSELHPSVYKLQSGQKEGLSLYGILNRCRCKFGSRLLRQWFHRPTTDMRVLRKRQEVIRFFTSPQNSDIMNTLQSFLRNIKNIPVLLHKMSLSNIKVADWQNLYKTVYSAVGIRDSVRSLPQTVQLFQEISEEFTDDLHYIATLISKVVDFEASLAENRFTIKPNVDPVIDEKKRRMMGLSDFLTDVARAELENLDPRFASCSVIYIPLIGFLLSVPRLPGMVEKENFEIEGLDFIFMSEDRLHYRTARTKELDNMLGDLHCDIRDMETAVMTQLQATILQRSSCLYKILALYAELDCLMSLAQASQEYDYCSPTYTERCTLNLQHARHPLVELCTPVFVSNPCICSETEGKVKVITGPNSSGKSIYLKQVGLIVFMALIGSDVPAKEAEIGLVDGIFTRMQSRESMSVGLSTFMIDLNQMAQALNYSSGMSLVLVDEFGKGTNTVDGLSLLAACLNHWLNRSPPQCPIVFLATNFHSVLQLDLLPRSPLLSLLTLETTVDGGELIFLYQLKEGICQSSYAANIATLAGLPRPLVQRGVEVSDLYRKGKTIQRIDQPSSEELFTRCERVVEKFLSLNLDDASTDLQSFLNDEVLQRLGEVL